MKKPRSAPPARAAGPTRERLKQAGGFFAIGGDARTGYRFTMADTPLGKALVRQKISATQHEALTKYAFHWSQAGLAGHVTGIDPNRVSSSGGAGLTGSEAAVYHLEQYRGAVAAIGLECAAIADKVACFEMKLTTVGLTLGYQSPSHGREQALQLLRLAGDRLAAHWNRPRR